MKDRETLCIPRRRTSSSRGNVVLPTPRGTPFDSCQKKVNEKKNKKSKRKEHKLPKSNPISNNATNKTPTQTRNGRFPSQFKNMTEEQKSKEIHKIHTTIEDLLSRDDYGQTKILMEEDSIFYRYSIQNNKSVRITPTPPKRKNDLSMKKFLPPKCDDTPRKNNMSEFDNDACSNKVRADRPSSSNQREQTNLPIACRNRTLSERNEHTNSQKESRQRFVDMQSSESKSLVKLNLERKQRRAMRALNALAFLPISSELHSITGRSTSSVSQCVDADNNNLNMEYCRRDQNFNPSMGKSCSKNEERSRKTRNGISSTDEFSNGKKLRYRSSRTGDCNNESEGFLHRNHPPTGKISPIPTSQSKSQIVEISDGQGSQRQQRKSHHRRSIDNCSESILEVSLDTSTMDLFDAVTRPYEIEWSHLCRKNSAVSGLTTTGSMSDDSSLNSFLSSSDLSEQQSIPLSSRLFKKTNEPLQGLDSLALGNKPNSTMSPSKGNNHTHCEESHLSPQEYDFANPYKPSQGEGHNFNSIDHHNDEGSSLSSYSFNRSDTLPTCESTNSAEMVDSKTKSEFQNQSLKLKRGKTYPPLSSNIENKEACISDNDTNKYHIYALQQHPSLPVAPLASHTQTYRPPLASPVISGKGSIQSGRRNRLYSDQSSYLSSSSSETDNRSYQDLDEPLSISHDIDLSTLDTELEHQADFEDLSINSLLLASSHNDNNESKKTYRGNDLDSLHIPGKADETLFRKTTNENIEKSSGLKNSNSMTNLEKSPSSLFHARSNSTSSKSLFQALNDGGVNSGCFTTTSSTGSKVINHQLAYSFSMHDTPEKNIRVNLHDVDDKSTYSHRRNRSDGTRGHQAMKSPSKRLRQTHKRAISDTMLMDLLEEEVHQNSFFSLHESNKTHATQQEKRRKKDCGEKISKDSTTPDVAIKDDTTSCPVSLGSSNRHKKRKSLDAESLSANYNSSEMLHEEVSKSFVLSRGIPSTVDSYAAENKNVRVDVIEVSVKNQSKFGVAMNDMRFEKSSSDDSMVLLLSTNGSKSCSVNDILVYCQVHYNMNNFQWILICALGVGYVLSIGLLICLSAFSFPFNSIGQAGGQITQAAQTTFDDKAWMPKINIDLDLVENCHRESADFFFVHPYTLYLPFLVQILTKRTSWALCVMYCKEIVVSSLMDDLSPKLIGGDSLIRNERTFVVLGILWAYVLSSRLDLPTLYSPLKSNRDNTREYILCRAVVCAFFVTMLFTDIVSTIVGRSSLKPSIHTYVSILSIFALAKYNDPGSRQYFQFLAGLTFVFGMLTHQNDLCDPVVQIACGALILLTVFCSNQIKQFLFDR